MWESVLQGCVNRLLAFYKMLLICHPWQLALVIFPGGKLASLLQRALIILRGVKGPPNHAMDPQAPRPIQAPSTEFTPS